MLKHTFVSLDVAFVVFVVVVVLFCLSVAQNPQTSHTLAQSQTETKTILMHAGRQAHTYTHTHIQTHSHEHKINSNHYTIWCSLDAINLHFLCINSFLIGNV